MSERQDRIDIGARLIERDMIGACAFEARLSYPIQRMTHDLLMNEIMYQKDTGVANADFLADLEKLRTALRQVMRYY